MPTFIVITGISQDLVMERAFELGACYYMLKPFDYELLVSRIKQLKGIGNRAIQAAGAEIGNRFLERNLESERGK